jgi:hypothetical protein
MRRRVTLACGHSFVESGNEMGEQSPRGCPVMNHVGPDRPDRAAGELYNPGVLYMTSQGMAMSEVIEYETLSD